MSSSNKLHAIYAALDNYHYAKAIKLCLQQPPSNLLVRVLMAHALAKSGQRYKSLQVVAALLEEQLQYFSELQLELVYAQSQEDLDANAATAAAASLAAQQSQQIQSVAKKGKAKGKKKATSATASPIEPCSTAATPVKHLDWIDRLDHPPRLPQDWDRVPPPLSDWPLFHDEHTLATLTTLMYRHLRLPLTAFMLYKWAVASFTTPSQTLLRKAFLSGLPVLVAPQYAKSQQQPSNVTHVILQSMQAVALQLAGRVQGTESVLALQWAAQACTWQIDLMERHANEDAAMTTSTMARLTELLVARALDSCSDSGQALMTMDSAIAKDESSDFLLQSECFLLYIDALDRQGKLEEKLHAIVERLKGSATEESNENNRNRDNQQRGQDQQLVYPPRRTLLDLQAQTLQTMGRFEEALVILTSQLQLYPDNWSFWKRHAECAAKLESGTQVTSAFAFEMLQQSETTCSSGLLLRGPCLIRVELAYQSCLLQQPGSNDQLLVAKLVDEIIVYSSQVAPRALCCYSDVEPYLNYILTTTSHPTREMASRRLLDWLLDFRLPPVSEDGKERRSELRKYIVAIQLTHKVVSHMERTCQFECLPDWKEYLKTWEEFKAYDIIHVDDPKENRPADELILLAVQQLLLQDSSDDANLVLISLILEAGMEYSPYNASLKIAALRVYGLLHAATRAYDLYQCLFIKHIQYESCAYLILPILRDNGLYEETLDVCKQVMRLQRISLNEAADYSGRAMENGARSKADEFVQFQRRQLSHSLTALEARGLVLDAAPMFGQADSNWVPGAFHGIIGSDMDYDRATEMITEAHDPLGAFAILQAQRNSDKNYCQWSDNRDLEVLPHEILSRRKVESTEDIVRDARQRGHVHGLLLRATLCIASSKGLKKGKVVEPSDEAKSRCACLLAAIEAFSNDCCVSAPLHKDLVKALLCSCRVIAGLDTGVFHATDQTTVTSLAEKESTIVKILEEQQLALESAMKELSRMEGDVVSFVSRLLPECVVPVFALCQIVSKLFNLYGWGRRKRSTKPCAAALANVASALAALLVVASKSVAGLPKAHEVPVNLAQGVIADIISVKVCRETISSIRHSQEVTYERITSLCQEMKKSLESFNVQE
ncbi:hypothetical protein MPSEU_000182000 [Mayamaea pseudoterrestris]|nr:hypothetical protein MPSEU_000182000 [Mayamaea pseudoterrestris]